MRIDKSDEALLAKATSWSTVESVTVGTSAVEVISSNTQRKYVIIQNTDDTNSIYLGNSEVTTGDGFEVTSGSTYIEDAYTGSIYAIGEAAGMDIRVVEAE